MNRLAMILSSSGYNFSHWMKAGLNYYIFLKNQTAVAVRSENRRIAGLHG